VNFEVNRLILNQTCTLIQQLISTRFITLKVYLLHVWVRRTLKIVRLSICIKTVLMRASCMELTDNGPTDVGNHRISGP